ncbi:glucose-6-phosphate dehydrogenase [Labrys wisconsinensis]|uniref:Glucose-6-phosphate 1-dehydrogenase n=1 Tax=Labrys wisconsinensis TaxID=425677 RepID=A0ABU0J4K1_9HYPH|nr:glucose-6-phosphate dehydrogenase [Labrys wisconsinensis]MDQ0469190.1 glucose-6-phosphate 1-dehydrogenase [Labrys wisconsinensis]
MAGLKNGRARRPDPCSFVIFGANGDLTKRLLVPALYNLAESNLLPEPFAIVGVMRSAISDEAFRQALWDGLKQFATRPVDPAIAEKLFASVSCVEGQTDDPDSYRRLGSHLKQVEVAHRIPGNRLFYLATPPTAFAPITRQLAQAGLTQEGEGSGWRRVIVEKPFGSDLDSAKALNRELLSVLSEDQIFRMDHYLGKETVQNIMIMRFANGLFEPIWNRNFIDHVQITVAETVNVERRGKFYDTTGAMRDMVPNHLSQLLSLIAMEPPAHYDAHAVRSEKAEALAAIDVYDEQAAIANSVRAQYGAGRVRDAEVIAYRQAQDVNPESTTETYAAIKLAIDNWRWAGVPFYLRTGKALARRKTEVAIKFKEAPISMFRDTRLGDAPLGLSQNYLVLNIQPEEGITLHFNAKVPGPTVALAPVGMTFNYKDYFESAPSTGYETLIYDCMIGDAMLFQRADGVEAGWRAVQPFLDAWRAAGHAGVATYAAGSEGPEEADALLARDGRGWRKLG